MSQTFTRNLFIVSLIFSLSWVMTEDYTPRRVEWRIRIFLTEKKGFSIVEKRWLERPNHDRWSWTIVPYYLCHFSPCLGPGLRTETTKDRYPGSCSRDWRTRDDSTSAKDMSCHSDIANSVCDVSRPGRFSFGGTECSNYDRSERSTRTRVSPSLLYVCSVTTGHRRSPVG